MPAWIVQTNRIIERVRIPIERLRISEIRHNRIRRHKPPNRAVVIPRVVVEQPKAIESLGGEGEIAWRCAILPVRRAKGIVPRMGDGVAGAGRRSIRGSKGEIQLCFHVAC